MSADTTNLFLLQDLDDPDRTKRLAGSDLNALRIVADWIRTFIVRPNEQLGRPGPVCPFVPLALERRTLWLAPERITSLDAPAVVDLMSGYRNLLLRSQPTDGENASYKAVVVVLTDLSADLAKHYGDDDQVQNLKRRSYEEDGVVMGEFHAGNEGSAIRNPSFHPFKSPVPFLLLRHAVVADWQFFLENDDWLSFWAHRFGESAVPALAEKLRHTNWRQLGS